MVIVITMDADENIIGIKEQIAMMLESIGDVKNVDVVLSEREKKYMKEREKKKA